MRRRNTKVSKITIQDSRLFKQTAVASNLIIRAIKKSMKVGCRYKITAIGMNHKGECIGMASNGFRQLGGDSVYKDDGSVFFRGEHAESLLLRRYGRKLSVIYIIRANINGKTLPIKPCKNCLKQASKLGVKIVSLTGETWEDVQDN